MRKEAEADFEAVRDVDIDDYADQYSEVGFWDKIKDNVSSIGMKLIYKALQLYYVAQSPDCPMKIKAGIYGALGYLISPIDFVPDFVPVVGYSDDAAAIALALALAQMYVTEEINAQARAKIRDVFGARMLAKLDEAIEAA
jgi:uncharacterized membrane protein YkvA (DUF1232 family)